MDLFIFRDTYGFDEKKIEFQFYYEERAVRIKMSKIGTLLIKLFKFNLMNDMH